MAETLSDLLTRCRGGDQDAYQVVIRRFQSKALDLAATLIGDRHLAEDAVQNAFWTAFTRLDQLREPDAFAGWFRQIVRTEAVRIARKKHPNRQTEMDEPIDNLSPHTIAAGQELRQLVQQAFDALPETNRQTAEMFYLDEQSCAQVAQKLSVPAGTVRRRLYDARQQLRKFLQGYL